MAEDVHIGIVGAQYQPGYGRLREDEGAGGRGGHARPGTGFGRHAYGLLMT
jgi:hypothetical protein